MKFMNTVKLGLKPLERQLGAKPTALTSLQVKSCQVKSGQVKSTLSPNILSFPQAF
jgi:hypothetical protein